METRQCEQCNKTFMIDRKDQEFYVRIGVPIPDYCPDCRAQRRLTVRNHWNYYNRRCDMCNKSIVSVYDPERIHNVYCVKCWWSDRWDARDHGRAVDFTKTVAEQFKELHQTVPKLAMMNDDGIQSQNCEYSNDFAFGKNVYMVVAAWYDENCLYGFQINHSRDSVDCTSLFRSEMCYDCSASENCFGCEHCHEVYNSRDCMFGYDLKNCDNCILSAGLRNKAYCIWNKQYSKSAFEQKRKALNLGSWRSRIQLSRQFKEFLLKIPRKHANVVNSEGCSGNHLRNSTNAQHCFIFPEIENGKYLVNGDGAKDCYDLYSTGHSELCYDSLTADDSYHVLFSNNCWKSQDIYYSDNCHSSRNLFACVGMKKEEYAVLNLPYTQKEYVSLKGKIIDYMKSTGEWGNFFGPKATVFAYNETAANEFYPLNKSDAIRLRYSWLDNSNTSTGQSTISWKKFPDNIKDIKNIVLHKEIFQCLNCNIDFRMIKEELDFYQKRQIPLPRYCMMCRYRQRQLLMGPHALWHRQCMCTQTDHRHKGRCSSEFETTYSPERKELVYCEHCYQKEIY